MPTSIAEAGYELSQSERAGDPRGRHQRPGWVRGRRVPPLYRRLHQGAAASPAGLLLRGSTLIEVARQAQADLDETLEVATGWFETFLEDNRIELEKLTRWYTLSCLALGGEIVLWLLGAPDILG